MFVKLLLLFHSPYSALSLLAGCGLGPAPSAARLQRGAAGSSGDVDAGWREEEQSGTETRIVNISVTLNQKNRKKERIE